MNRNRIYVAQGGACLLIIVVVIVAIFLLFASFFEGEPIEDVTVNITPQARPVAAPEPTLTLSVQRGGGDRPAPPVEAPELAAGQPASLTSLYSQLNPGVVNIQVYVNSGIQMGQGAGSGFLLDDRGYIVTNNHVVADASLVTVVFYDGTEVAAEVVGADADSDLAVLKVDEIPEGAHPLPLADSSQVSVGEWVVAIGNPFQLGGSMSVGVVSAVGRTIPSGATPFSIPEAIQTDAAINPGNSGGPLLNLNGEVIGVNAQILTRGSPANVGVGFAIPSNVVRQVVPSLIENGAYFWPWLGVEGGSVSLAVKQANDLETQKGAYITDIVPGGPADEAGLRGSTNIREVAGLDVPVGGDVIIEADGEPVTDFADLLIDIASKLPGDTIELTVLRNGQSRQITVTLAPRPAGFGP